MHQIRALFGRFWEAYHRHYLATLTVTTAVFLLQLFHLYWLRRQVTFRALLYVILLNTQWIHMFWITDQVVVDNFAGHGLISWNGVVAWIAILIDYLEVPVIIDSLIKVFRARHEIWARIRANTLRRRPSEPKEALAGGGTMPAGAEGRAA